MCGPGPTANLRPQPHRVPGPDPTGDRVRGPTASPRPAGRAAGRADPSWVCFHIGNRILDIYSVNLISIIDDY